MSNLKARLERIEEELTRKKKKDVRIVVVSLDEPVPDPPEPGVIYVQDVFGPDLPDGEVESFSGFHPALERGGSSAGGAGQDRGNQRRA